MPALLRGPEEKNLIFLYIYIFTLQISLYVLYYVYARDNVYAYKSNIDMDVIMYALLCAYIYNCM